MTINELREKRNQAWEAAKAFVEAKKDKDGLLSDADRQTYAQMEQKVKDYGAEIERMAKEIADFKAEFAEEFEDYFKEKVCEWINVNLTCIIGNAVRFVTFGISDTGRLAINIPTNWEFLQFSMTNDAESPNYGKLAINY